MNEIQFGNYSSYTDLGLILNSKEIGSPSIKTHYVEVEGMDGVLDYTEYFGEPKYNNLTMKFDFQAIKTSSAASFSSVFSNVKDKLHGRSLHIVLPDDPDFYYVGRCSVSSFTNSKNIGNITITCDCNPFKYKKFETSVSKNVVNSEEFILPNMRKKVVPTITTDATFSFTFNGTTTEHNAGTFIIPTMELQAGNNTVLVEGTGHCSFTYQEGGL